VTLVGRHVSDRWYTPADCYTTLIIGEPRIPRTLERAEIRTAWAVLALSEEEYVNVPVALAAKQTYDVSVVVALVDQMRAPEYRRLGIDLFALDSSAESVVWTHVAARLPGEILTDGPLIIGGTGVETTV
jgi:Trk K+ transport system NAD-binding subunit